MDNYMDECVGGRIYKECANGWMGEKYDEFNVNKKIQLDATVSRLLFTAELLYMFRASLLPSSGVLKTVTATSGIGHDIGVTASFQRGLIRTSVSEFFPLTLVLIRPRWKEAATSIS
jgi:hypothetical protein